MPLDNSRFFTCLTGNQSPALNSKGGFARKPALLRSLTRPPSRFSGAQAIPKFRETKTPIWTTQLAESCGRFIKFLLDRAEFGEAAGIYFFWSRFIRIGWIHLDGLVGWTPVKENMFTRNTVVCPMSPGAQLSLWSIPTNIVERKARGMAVPNTKHHIAWSPTSHPVFGGLYPIGFRMRRPYHFP